MGQTGSDKLQLQLRLGFIKKVLGILTVQLLITFAFCLAVTNNSDFYQFMITTPG